MSRNEADLKKDRDEAYSQASRHWGKAITEMKKDLNFALGDQWEDVDRAYLKQQRREALVFNKTHRIIKILTGFQRKNRLSLKFEAGHAGKAKTAEQFNKIAMQLMAITDGYNVMSDAFEKGAVTTGINLVGLHVDYEHDLVSGDIQLTRWPYNSFLIDPNTTQFDLSNSGYLLLREFMDKNTAKTMIPVDQRKLLDELHARGQDEKFPELQGSKLLDGTDPYRYDRFWYQDTETYDVLIDPQFGVFAVINPDDPPETKRTIMASRPEIKVVKRTRKIVRVAIFIEDILFYEGNPYGINEYPFVPVWGFFTPEAKSSDLKIQGLVRLVRDPQTEVNKRKSKMLDIMDSMVSSGWKAKQNSVVDPDSLYISGQGKVIWVKDGYELDDIREIVGGKIPEGLFKLNEIFDQDIVQIPGANDDLLGTPQSEDMQVAGVLAKMRQSSGVTILQDLFDNYRRSEKLLGTKIIKMIQKNYMKDKVQRMIGEDPTEDFYDASFSVYDCVPTEGLLTDTQRHMHFMQLMSLKQMGAPIPFSYIIAQAPVDGQQELIEMMQQAEQGESEKAQQMGEMEQVFSQLQAAKTQAEITDAEQNVAVSEQKRARAALENIRMLKEIQELDLTKITELLKVAKEIEQVKAHRTTRR